MKNIFVVLISFVMAFIFGCTSTKQLSYFDAKPALLTKKYTLAEITEIQKNFESDPLQISQQMGDLLLWQMYQKSPEFALEFAQTPELNDGIDVKEAKAMSSIYGLIKYFEFPQGLYKKKLDENILKIILKWTGNSEDKTDWSGLFEGINNTEGGIGRAIDIKPIGMESDEDNIYNDFFKKNGEIIWDSKSSLNDTDSIIATIDYFDKHVIYHSGEPPKKSLSIYINNNTITINYNDLITKDKLLFNEKDGLQGTLKIINSSKNIISPEQYAIRDMILAGEGDLKFSASLQALLWAYMDADKKDFKVDLKDYLDSFEFLKSIWGDMEGPRWEDFDDVTSRLNSPELLDYYERKKISYDFYISNNRSNKAVFQKKAANCWDTTNFTVYTLKKAGYSAKPLWVESGDPEGHIITIFKDNNKKYIMDNGTEWPRGIIGPFNSFKETGYTRQTD